MKKMESQNLQLLVGFMAVQLYLCLDVQFLFQNCLGGSSSSGLCLIKENYTVYIKEINYL